MKSKRITTFSAALRTLLTWVLALIAAVVWTAAEVPQ